MRAVFLLIAALVCAPVAAAQADACARYQLFLDASLERFDRLKGADISLQAGLPAKGMAFVALRTPRDLPLCLIGVGDKGSARATFLGCRREGLTESEARDFYEREVEALGACLAGWRLTPPEPDADNEMITLVDGQHFKKEAGSQNLGHGVMLTRTRVGGPNSWAVVLTFSVSVERPVS